MTIQEFAAKYRVRIKLDSCRDRIIPGKLGSELPQQGERMRRKAIGFGASLLGMLLAAAALAQTPTPTVPTVVRWQEEATHRAEFFVQGQLIHAVERDGLIVSACLEDADHQMRALVAVVNNSKQPIDVIPSSMALEITSPEIKTLPFVDPQKVARSKGHVSRWAYVFAAMAGMGGQQSTSTGTVTMDDGSTGTFNATTTTPNTAAKERALKDIERSRVRKEATAHAVEDTALLPNTVLPGSRIIGWVYFAGTKRHTDAVLRIPLGNYIFELPFGWTTKK